MLKICYKRFEKQAVMERTAERKLALQMSQAANDKIAAQAQESEDGAGNDDAHSSGPVSLLQRGKSSTNLGTPSKAAATTKGALSTAAVSEWSPSGKGQQQKQTLAQGLIARLPLGQLISGHNLGRSYGPAEAKMKLWANDADQGIVCQADVVREHLAKCRIAMALARQDFLEF